MKNRFRFSIIYVSIMARAICNQCHRPVKVCICDFVSPIENRIEIGIFQHPSEQKQVKGSAILAHLALNKSTLWVGESIEDVPSLKTWIEQGPEVLLLYSETEASSKLKNIESKIVDTRDYDSQPFKVLVLDGTWRKTFKMMQLNPEIKALNRIAIAPTQRSAYKIRKQKNEHALSTVEAIAELLSQLEKRPEIAESLQSAFEKMQNQQLAIKHRQQSYER